MTTQEQEFARLKEEAYKARSQALDMRLFISSILGTVIKTISVIRIILYAGSVLGAWFYLHDHALAIAVVTALTVSHGLMNLKAHIIAKEAKLKEYK